MTRSAAVIPSDDGGIALIRRVRAGRTFYVSPGGGDQPGETPADAMVREVKEELGLVVKPVRLLAEVSAGEETQLYFLATTVGGAFGTGGGAEVTGRTSSSEGTYTPVWMPIERLRQIEGWPRRLLDVVADAPTAGWPDQPLRFHEQPTSPDAGHSRAD